MIRPPTGGPRERDGVAKDTLKLLKRLLGAALAARGSLLQLGCPKVGSGPESSATPVSTARTLRIPPTRLAWNHKAICRNGLRQHKQRQHMSSTVVEHVSKRE